MKCSFCNRSTFKKKFLKYSTAQKKNIQYLKCSYCNSLHQFPLPNKKIIKNYYETYIETKKILNPGYLDNANMMSLFSERDKTFSDIGFNKDWIKKSINVELGCANGHFLMYLKKNGAKNIIGIDISKQLINNIKMNDINLIIGDLSKLRSKSIDNLFMFNVLEHIADIKLLMNQIISKIKKNSKILIEVPLSGIISSAFKYKWRFLMPDEHLHIPSLKGLKILLKQNKLKIISCVRFGSGYTTGMIPFFLKNILDKLAKFFHYGDRGAFLIVNDS